MKKLLLSLVIFLSIPFLSVAQEDSLPVVYRTWITVNNNLQRIEGILYGIKDSSIFITNSFSRTDCLSGNFSGTTIGYNFINNVKVRRNNSVIVGSFLGAAVGFGTGAQMHQPLAIAVIGGFVIALPLLLIIFPTLLHLLYKHEDKKEA